MKPAEFVKKVSDTLYKNANSQNAKAMKKYLLDQFEFIGLKKPQRAALCKPLFAEVKPFITEKWILETAALLWKKREREFHYVALDLFEKNKKLITPASFKTLKKMIVTNSWWDSVDGISSYAIAPLLLNYPKMKKEMERFAKHKNMWLNRVAIIHQILYKEKTDTEFLYKVCERHMHREEFFIRKAIGWALRQHAKTNRKEVYAFVEKNKQKLSGLSYREALKHK
ncbi:MAG: DNA alkylation repair protein [Bacteroidia bacterium]|jgi:3-methyladenine DNA glycosylase AlkD|nr:DNA alkylation repair protein [Bacteroidia bacterium]